MCCENKLCRPVAAHGNVFLPVAPDDINILLGSEAAVFGGPFEHSSGDRIHMLWMENWTSLDDSFQWNVSIAERGYYVIQILVCSHFKMSSGYNGGSSPVALKLEFYRWPSMGCDNSDETCLSGKVLNEVVAKVEHQVVYSDAPVMMQFAREIVADSVALPAGPLTVKLSVKELPEEGELNLSFHSLEMMTREVLDSLKSEKEELLGDTSWLRNDARYGLFFHWNSFTLPLKGDKLAYEDAVNRFDVEHFVDIVHQSGANVIIFTTNWAGYHFPAAIRSIDRILQGRTTKRDLIAEISEGLKQVGVRFILYYHYGKDDDEWFRAMNFTRGARNEYFWDCWCEIIAEIGNRYGTAFDGWWIDDGMTGYYPHRAPWRRMWRALKAGNPKRVVGYNPWALPKPTDLQELYAGEMSVLDISFLPGLAPGSTGVFETGPQVGLYATFSSLLQNGDWTFMRGGSIDQRTGQMTGEQGEDTDFAGLQISLPEIIWGVGEARRRSALAVFNLLISQEGAVCHEAQKLLRGLSLGLEAIESGSVVAVGPSSAHQVEHFGVPLAVELATTGPWPDGPLFWRRSNALIGWNADPKAFASWEVKFVGFQGRVVEFNFSVVMSCDAECEGLSISVGSVLLNTPSLQNLQHFDQSIEVHATLDLPRTGGMDDFIEVSVGKIAFMCQEGGEERRRIVIMLKHELGETSMSKDWSLRGAVLYAR